MSPFSTNQLQVHNEFVPQAGSHACYTSLRHGALRCPRARPSGAAPFREDTALAAHSRCTANLSRVPVEPNGTDSTAGVRLLMAAGLVTPYLEEVLVVCSPKCQCIGLRQRGRLCRGLGERIAGFKDADRES